MANGHGDWQAARIGGMGSPIGGRPSGPQKEDEKMICGGNSVPGVGQRVRNASGSTSKGATGVVSDCCEMYCP